MKKILSLLSTISLSTIISTNIIACSTPKQIDIINKPTKPEYKPQIPPKNSNWKLMPKASFNRLSHPDYLNIEDNINYIFIYNNNIPANYKIIKIINDGYKINSNIYKFVGEYIVKRNSSWNSIVETSYRWNGNGEPTIPTIDTSTGKITDWEVGSELNLFDDILDEVIKENIRVQQGGSSNYEKLDVNGTQKIIFDFEIVDGVDKDKIKKVVYRMILTINCEQIIRAGSISLIYYVNDQYDDDKLNFSFDFFQSALDDENLNSLWEFKIENYIYQQQNKFIYNQLKGLIYINDFLKQFFSNILMPVFTNRGAFMEASYLDFLTFDTVVVNFLGLQSDNFLSVVRLHNVSNDKVQQEQKDEIEFKMKWKNILNSSFKIMNNFYKNYLRSLFDLENETYIQGYNKKFGLLVSNGFKIFPKYFYFSDKYKNLDVKIYSSHANKFYQTKYGRVFNFDYSVFNDFKVYNTNSYLFDDRKQYQLRVKDLSIQKVGYGVFELQAQKENEFYHYYDFNFGIYNWKDLTSLVDKPVGQWWNEYVSDCKWYDMVCHIKNGAIWIVNNIPGVKQANELASGVGKLFQVSYNFFSQTFEIWKFNLDFYIVITNTFLLIIFMKFIRMF